MKVKIKVLKKIILQGHRCEAASCPIALAIQAHLKPSFRVSVGTDICGIYHTEDGKRCAGYVLPNVAQKFIAEFDLAKTNKRKLRSFSFELEISDEYLLNPTAKQAVS